MLLELGVVAATAIVVLVVLLRRTGRGVAPAAHRLRAAGLVVMVACAGLWLLLGMALLLGGEVAGSWFVVPAGAALVLGALAFLRPAPGGAALLAVGAAAFLATGVGLSATVPLSGGVVEALRDAAVVGGPPVLAGALFRRAARGIAASPVDSDLHGSSF